MAAEAVAGGEVVDAHEVELASGRRRDVVAVEEDDRDVLFGEDVQHAACGDVGVGHEIDGFQQDAGGAALGEGPGERDGEGGAVFGARRGGVAEQDAVALGAGGLSN